MLSNATAPTTVDRYAEADSVNPPRRIRHITGVQIRNLTPFPVRDAVTTALTQPTEQSHYMALGTLDDLGAILSRRHARKASTASATTRPSLKWDDGIPEDKDTKHSIFRGRKTSTSSTLSLTNSNISTSSSRSTRSLRGHRPRTSSIASSSSNFVSNVFDARGESSTFASALLPDNSQTGLEKIIKSRLVESFIVISIPENSNQYIEIHNPEHSFRSAVVPGSAPRLKTPMVFSSRRHIPGASEHLSKKNLFLAMSHKRGISVPGSAPPSQTMFKAPIAQKQDDRKDAMGKLNGVKFPPPVFTPQSLESNSLQEAEQNITHLDKRDIPVYHSPIHRPSTNPLFPIDAHSGQDFPEHINTSGQFLKVEVWTKIPLGSGSEETRLSSEFQERATSTVPEWRLLQRRDIDLTKLLPIPADLDANPSQLPSNTIVITLSPPGHAFYLPASLFTPSRPPSPHDGYTSDPELEVRKVKRFANVPPSAPTFTFTELLAPHTPRRKGADGNFIDIREHAKTGTWQDLFKLVSVQSLISDNESSLRDVIWKIDAHLEEDTGFILRRELSEREARLEELKADHQIVLNKASQMRVEISERSQRLQTRSEMLGFARDALQLNTEIDVQVENQRDMLTSVHSRTDFTRTSLVSALSAIFPIELYSPPDLLYTILDVPLPIPLNSNDPAPPLTMSEHKDVSEDSVATALGYVAQVLQILAAYMGKSLTYPVTCIGSRSVIRDGISAMVGPRMFPLFSKGVDTYRFEYGVFLLNKDIEMLMSERDLRALDMRHTLPNLKNLLLTLSDDNALHQQPPRVRFPAASPISSTGLATPPREPSPVIDDVHTPKPSHIVLETHGLGEGTTTPTASGTTTPTASIMSDDARKQRSFLGFVPFLRGRYPSSASQSSEKTPTRSTHQSQTEDGVDEDSDSDEEDRTTIHGIILDGVPDTLSNSDGGIVAET